MVGLYWKVNTLLLKNQYRFWENEWEFYFRNLAVGLALSTYYKVKSYFIASYTV